MHPQHHPEVIIHSCVLPAARTVLCVVSNSEAWLHASPMTFPLCISMWILKTNWLDDHHMPGTAGASGSELLYSTQYFHLLLPFLSLVSLKQPPSILATFNCKTDKFLALELSYSLASPSVLWSHLQTPPVLGVFWSEAGY